MPVKETTQDFITRQVLTRNNIVTYRSLSRDREIHVNQAKNELAAFYSSERSNSSTLFATYVICGEPIPISAPSDEAMDVDGEDRANTKSLFAADSELVKRMKMLMVGEKHVERAKKQFGKISSVYIYSVSPSPLQDAGLLSESCDHARKVDNSKDADFARTVGRIVSKEVTLKNLPRAKLSKTPAQSVASSSKTTAAQITSSKGGSTTDTKSVKDQEVQQPKPAAEEKGKGKEKAKPTGKIDFFTKAKPKEAPAKTEKAKETQDKEKSSKKKAQEGSRPPSRVDSRPPSRAASVPKPEQSKSTNESSKKPAAKAEPEQSKRGVKRKSTTAVASDTEMDSAPTPAPAPKAKNNASGRVKNGMIMSSDEEDEVEPVVKSSKKKGKGRAQAADSDNEDLRAMMEIDDADVDRVVRPEDVPNSDRAVVDDDDEDESKGEDPDLGMDVDDDRDEISRKRREKKKVHPRGRNGLKKRRVLKTRRTKDAKGYMITEDYSSYESVSEEEPEPVQPKKPAKKEKKKEDDSPSTGAGNSETKSQKKKAATGTAKKAESSTGSDKTAAKPKASAKKKPGQKDIASFFASKPKA